MSCLVASVLGQAAPGTTEQNRQGTAGAGQTGTGQYGHGESRKIEGQWQVVYVEMDGKKIENKDFASVTIQNNKLTCRHDGKEKSWTLEFGPHHQVRAEETTSGTTTGTTTSGAAAGQTGKSATTGNATSGTANTTGARDRHSHGVYIASKEYLAFSMNHGPDTTGGTGRPAGATSSSNTTGGNTTGNQNTTGGNTTANQNRTGSQNTTGDRNTTTNPSTTGSSSDHGIYGSHFVLILKRADGSTSR